MSVCIITVNFNGAGDTIEFIESVDAQVGAQADVFVVDNGSESDDVDLIRRAHPHVRVIETGMNLGFAEGNNLAIEAALALNYDYLLLINNDTVMEPDALAELLRCADAHADAGIVAPLMYRYADRVTPWFTGSAIDMIKGVVEHIDTDVRALHKSEPYEAPWITGCAMLIRANAARLTGGFDKRFFCYFEDTDLSFRVKKAGLGLLVCPQAVIYHKVGSSFGECSLFQHYYMTRNKMLFFSKHLRGKARRELIWKLTRESILPAVHQMRHNRGRIPGGHVRVGAAAAIDFYLHRFGHTYKQVRGRANG